VNVYFSYQKFWVIEKPTTFYYNTYIVSMWDISREWFILLLVRGTYRKFQFNIWISCYNDIQLNFLFHDISLPFHKIIVLERIKTFCISTWQYFQFVFNVCTCKYIFYLNNNNNNYDDFFFLPFPFEFLYIFFFI